jgi:cell wall-associated NlpC family hydrolase
MRRHGLAWLLLPALAGMVAGCAHYGGGGSAGDAGAAGIARATNALREVKVKYTTDGHLGIFTVGVLARGSDLVLTGDVDRAEARIEAVRAVESTGARVRDKIEVLPSARLGDKTWGISCLSVASGREQPEHKAEMGTQILMGEVVRIWKRSTNAIFTWYYSQAEDGYLSWLEKGTFVPCTREDVEAWNRGPLLIVTAFEDCILEQPRADAQPVSDVVPGDLVKKTGEEGDWFKVELPDHRSGFLPKKSAEDYVAWKQSRHPTPENIERTARRLIGRPYLWGGYSPKGLDCSGFTKLVFFLNGIELKRNASHQARQGVEVPLDKDLSQLKKGDLLFFGPRARRRRPERITHAGIYLGDKLFIQSSGRVQISSLDPHSPIRDEFRIRTLLHARRILNADAISILEPPSSLFLGRGVAAP